MPYKWFEYIVRIYWRCIALFVTDVYGGKMGITSKLFYMTGFFLVWYMMLHSGIHPTIAGVLSALTIPARPKLNLATYVANLKSSVEKLPPPQIRFRRGY